MQLISFIRLQFKTLFNSLIVPKVVYGIIFIGFFLRIWGIRYGFPLQLNVDEPSLISGVLSLNHSLNPNRFDWPHLYFYINAGFYGIFVTLRALLGSIFTLPENFYSANAFFLISRFLSVLFGTATILVIYKIGETLYNKKIGIISALLLAVLPIHVYESHLAKLDIAHTFFVALAVLYMVKYFKERRNILYVWIGFWIGVSTSIKYNSVLLFLPVVVLYLVCIERNTITSYFKEVFNPKRFQWPIYAGIISILVFYIGTPYALVDYKTFFESEEPKGAMWQFSNVGKVTVNQYQYELFETFFEMYYRDLGLFLWLVFMLLMVIFIFFNRRSRKDVFLLFPVVFLSFYISHQVRSPSHYFLMLIPFYLVAIAAFLEDVVKVDSKKSKLLIYLLFFIVFSTSLFESIKASFLFARVDTREVAYAWVKENLDENNDFLFVNGEELASIPFKKNETERIKKVDRDGIHYKATPFYIVIGVEGLTQEELLAGDRDPEELKGNSNPILEHAELMLAVDDKNRLGPPIYIFKVTQIDPE